MNTLRRAVAAAELLLLVPAALFMAALFMRNVVPERDPPNVFQGVVMWYEARSWSLPVLLFGLPLVVLTVGCAALVQNWRSDAALRRATGQALVALRPYVALLLVAVAVVPAGSVLAIVAFHALAN